MIASPANQHRIALLGFCVALFVAWVCYRPAIGGAFQLDDQANLSGLAFVEDAESAWDFILSGTAGPTGRPLALATFAWQADSYSDGAGAFISTNIFIHLVNAIVLAGCLFQLALMRSIARHQAAIIAAIAASFWVLLPLLATASMLVAQRMTTLSAMFVLLGLAGYLHARTRIDITPKRALAGMTGSLVAGTVFAALCKESGLLLPVFVVVIESTLLERPANVAARLWRTWQIVMLFAPLTLLLVFLASVVSYTDYAIARRGFNGWERLLTETRLLWSYLHKAVLGLPSQLGIFQGSPAVSRSLFEPLTLLASLAWIVSATLGIVWRRRYPLAAFAVLWFLAGHLLESTVIPLELYFEHRNYLAIAGPVFALIAMAVLARPQLRRSALVVAAVALCMNAYWLYGFATLWGQPSAAARFWANQYPDSVRAVTTLATYQLTEEGPLTTLQTLDRYIIDHPQHAYLRIQELNLLCRIAPDQDHDQVIERLNRRLPTVTFTYTAGTMLSELFSASASTGCASVTPQTVAELADQLRNNPRYSKDNLYNQFHFKLLAGIARYQGNYDATIDYLQKAIAAKPSSELNMMMVTALAGAGDFDAANEFIEDAHKRGPANPVRAIRWRRDLDGLLAYVTELEKSTRENE